MGGAILVPGARGTPGGTRGAHPGNAPEHPGVSLVPGSVCVVPLGPPVGDRGGVVILRQVPEGHRAVSVLPSPPR